VPFAKFLHPDLVVIDPVGLKVTRRDLLFAFRYLRDDSYCRLVKRRQPDGGTGRSRHWLHLIASTAFTALAYISDTRRSLIPGYQNIAAFRSDGFLGVDGGRQPGFLWYNAHPLRFSWATLALWL
jgi:hypothetical protein